jgi:hypothetical protein
MSQISKVIFTTLAASLTLGAVQLAAGQEFAGRFQAIDEAGTPINRSAKGDREANIPAAATPTRTIQLRVDSLADTSVLVRVPIAKEARNVPAATKPAKADRKMAVACEPTVSVLTEVAKLLQPGRCVT